MFWEWLFLSHNSVSNPNKPGKFRCVGNAASKYKDVCLKTCGWQDLFYCMASLEQISDANNPDGWYWVNVFESAISWSREEVPNIFEGTGNLLHWVRISNNSARFLDKNFTCMLILLHAHSLVAFKRVGIENWDDFFIISKAIHNKFYIDNLINSVENAEKTIAPLATTPATKIGSLVKEMDQHKW